MKRRTWIISALMYAMVFMVCVGVLHVLKKMTEPSVPSGAGSSEYTAQAPENGEGGSGGKRPEGEGGEGEDGEGEDGEAEGGAGNTGEAGNGTGTDHIKRQTGYSGWKQQISQVWTPEPQEEPYKPPRIILATDLHYQSREAGDGGAAFQEFAAQSDGKVIQYLPELLEAFLDEVIEDQPSALVLSGDITMNGEKLNHEELAARLKRVQEAGIPVLIIPGNHDINNTGAAVYLGEKKTPAASVTPQEFLEIYGAYGYDQALSRDEHSLSYVYQLDEKNRLLMLDSCQYEPRNLVEGRLKEETLQWMDEQLDKAQKEEMTVIPVAHHNLLAQSRMYTTQCAMENNGEVIELLQKYKLPVFFSGHLHVQRIRKHKSEPGEPEDAYGIREIITDAISIPPCQYGEIIWQEDGSLRYETRSVDVSSWARKKGSSNPDLLDFENWSYTYIMELISAQIRSGIKNLGEEAEASMASVYAGVYIDYYAGREIDAAGVRSSVGYRFWQRNMPDSRLLRELEAMMTDADRDNNYCLLPELWEAD